MLSILSYGALTSGAAGPGYGSIGPMAPKQSAPKQVAQATLSFSGKDAIITGSVDHMFQTAAFTGPNRLEKQDRARLGVDVLGMTRSFDKARTLLAEARIAAGMPSGGSETIVADAVVPQSAHEVKLASVDPTAVTPPLDSPALSAIDKSVGADPRIPTPLAASSQLAYARANAPATVFDNSAKADKFSQKDLWCLATAVYFEARGESYRGQVAVAQVVMNRLHHPLYPKTICGVVYQNQNMRNACQFSFACDGIPETVNDPKSWKQAEDIAKQVSNGDLYLTEVANATHYHAAYVYPDWAPRLHRVTKIGQHIFYRFKGSAATLSS
jgi:spore germination cell wall hydrolase CwlJ-like protein